MDHTPQRLQSLTFEIEGLLMLVEKRDDMTPAAIYDMLVAKSDELARGIAELAGARLDEKGEAAAEEPAADDTTVEEAVAEAIAEAETITETAAEQEPVATAIEAEAATEAAQEAAATLYEEQADAEPCSPEPEPEPEPEPIEETIVEETIEEPTPVAPAAPVAPVAPVAAELKPVKLTLNDKFRFARTLFEGSESDLRDALDTIATLSDMGEVEDFLYNDLCLDADNDDTIAFVEAIAASRN